MTHATTERAEAAAPGAPGSRGGFGTVLRVQLRTGWAAPVIWVVSLIAGYAATVGAIDGLYGTPEQLATYQATVGSDPAMAAINGTPYGADTLGGVVSNEFGFISAIAIPLMGLLLVARQTRALEEVGLLELLRSRSVGAHAPWMAALLTAVFSSALVGVGMAVTLIAYDVDAADAWLYGTSMTLLGCVFAGLAVFVGQLVLRARGVSSIGVLVIGFAYVTRAIGDVRDSWWKWLSPLAWQQETRPFADDARVWPLAISFGVALAFAVVGLVLVGRRDLGSAVFAARPGRTRASSFAGTALGLALRAHSATVLAWSVGAAAISGVFGAFTDDIADAVAANPALEGMLGGSGSGSANDAYAEMVLLILVFMAMGCLGQAVGRMREEETSGRLETTLARSESRVWWMAAHGLVAMAGAALIVLVGSAVLAWSAGDETHGVVAAGFAYLAAVLVFGALGLLLLGVLPRFTAAIWAVLGVIVFLALLGSTLSLPDWVLALSPVQAVGHLPGEDVSASAEWALVGIAAVLAAVGLVGFRRRDIPS
ncbi:ABC-2 type transport system permease protein [Agromyces terreus]|uniref:ABC-2 type transport system permease protein n=1 Tax=Agromyces terreus TaxID=424795 RepID=A0A9X2GXZ8_9MICO|nr:hypothetical protein [Agromyces terreus]MCP2369516.1 ABC-2 type transport system permease protein [Agromyces terreus]